MFAVTAEDLQRVIRDAVYDLLGRAGAARGLPTLTWVPDFGVGGVTAVTGQVSAGHRDPEQAAQQWADELRLRLVGDFDAGVVTYVGELPNGLPITVWAVVDRDRWEAAAAALMERIRQP